MTEKQEITVLTQQEFEMIVRFLQLEDRSQAEALEMVAELAEQPGLIEILKLNPNLQHQFKN